MKVIFAVKRRVGALLHVIAPLKTKRENIEAFIRTKDSRSQIVSTEVINTCFESEIPKLKDTESVFMQVITL